MSVEINMLIFFWLLFLKGIVHPKMIKLLITVN